MVIKIFRLVADVYLTDYGDTNFILIKPIFFANLH